jgi:hypothetical protein
MEPTSKAGTPTVTERVTCILKQSTHKALLNAQWVVKYFYKTTETSDEYKSIKTTYSEESEQKQIGTEPINKVNIRYQVLNEPVQPTTKKFEICNAHQTSQNNEVSIDTNAEKQKISAKTIDKEVQENNGNKDEQQDYDTNKLTETPETTGVIEIEVKSTAKYNEVNTSDTAKPVEKHQENQAIFKYGSSNYYAVLDTDFSGSY